ncbi:tuberoinfundibular peptide of 39 residues [Pholidichthys leucotaenia]
MSPPPVSSRLSLLILGMISMTSSFPQPQLPLRSSDDSEGQKRDGWDVLFPSISLRDWNIQMMSAPSLRAAAQKTQTGLMREPWVFGPEASETSVEGAWPTEWSSPGAGMAKRNMVVADDAAFREKSKFLTSMERQKWLNSYMQKLLVVNS